MNAADQRPRVSCPECFCEIGFGAHPERSIAHVAADELALGARTHKPLSGEPPLDFDPECECRCHDVWRFAFRGVPMRPRVPRS